MLKTLKKIPPHLKKYIVKQNIAKYSHIDQAAWRFIMKQLTTFLEEHAHECYIEGLEKTGISLEEIPSIENINKQLNKFGWAAVPVSGFIPPAAFMELQSLGVLPIASDMRTLEHLNYTPAPDIVHEAAGHAPILIHPEFSEYLHLYAQVAAKAILSHEDLAQYDAIRVLSDLKESPNSTPKQIEDAEKKLIQISKSISYISEGAELARMNWWTAEYGLIGDIKNPKIYGAGLLSSVGESRSGLTAKAKKIPMSLDCIKYAYDITEPQPQLFVTPDFKTLKNILNEFKAQMAFVVGGVKGLEKSKKAKSVNTVELDSGVQISGKLKDYHKNSSDEVIYLQFEGPCQISYKNKQLKDHGKNYHKQGYGSPLGKYSTQKLGKVTRLNFDSGVIVEGELFKHLKKDKKTLLLSFKKCTVTYGSHVFFEPSWGIYDMALGLKVTSVFGGPADKRAYGELESFVAHRVQKINLSKEKKILDKLYAEVRTLRNKFKKTTTQIEKLKSILNTLESFKTEWLLRLEILELLWSIEKEKETCQKLLQFFSELNVPTELKETIQNGVKNITKTSNPSNTHNSFFAKTIHSTLV